MPVRVDPAKLSYYLSKCDDPAESIAAARLDYGAVYGWLNGVGSPTVEEVRRLARIFGVPIDYFAEILE